MKTIIVSILLLFATATNATEPLCDRLQLYGLSYHKDREPNYNELNLGLGCERNYKNDVFVSVGAYVNSYGDPTLQGSVGWTFLELGNFHFGAVAGALYGYNDSIDFIPPIPVVRYFFGKNLGATTYITPTVIMLYFTKEFK